MGVRVDLSFALALLALLPARAASADECSGLMSPCVNDDTLWPHAGPAQFVAVGSTDTVAKGRLGFGLVATYLSRPIVLKVASPGPPGSKQYVVDDQVNGTFLWSYGVGERLELDLAMPLTFGQSGTGLSPVTGGDGLKDTAIRDLRFGFAYRILSRNGSKDSGRSDGLALLGRFEVSAPSGDHNQFAGERSGVFAPSLAGEYRLGRLFAGIELGARIRPATELLGARIGTQIVAAFGAGYDILPREMLTATLEAWALPGLSEQDDILAQPQGGAVAVPNGRRIAPAEWELSARTAPLQDGDFSIQAGGGGGIPLSGEPAITTPRFRFTLGVRWTPQSERPDRR